jgi:DNA polymerase III gamma/tau subunit
VPFREISGHRRTLALLSGSIALGTLPPSLIFSGITGIGKRRTALALAQTLNCPSPLREATFHAGGASVSDATLPIDACGECPS